MELKKMEALWKEMSKQLETQKKLTDQIIIDMTQEKYNNKFRTIAKLETIGALVCLAFFVFIIFNINKLDTWYLLLCGVFCAAFYLFFPILSLLSIYNLKKINISRDNYKDTIIKFTVRKKHFLKIQKIGIILCFFLLIAVLPVAIKIMDGKDLFLQNGVWMWYLPISSIFLFFGARWGYNSYRRITYSAEMILQETHL